MVAADLVELFERFRDEGARVVAEGDPRSFAGVSVRELDPVRRRGREDLSGKSEQE